MTFGFDSSQGLIIVPTRVSGPGGDTVARLALDTGAMTTLLGTALLVWLGYDPAAAPERVRVTTGSGVEFAPVLSVDRLDALGQSRKSFPIICHTLPPSASVDGLLGLDFFRGQRLTVDFRLGQIALE